MTRSKNGTTPKIEIDLNRITRREFREYLNTLIGFDSGSNEADLLTGELVEKVVVSWPYEQPVTQDGYMGLGLINGKDVDEALKVSFADITEKN